MWHLKSKPFEVQLETMRRSHDRDGYGFWLEMGLGKTQTALNDFVGAIVLDKVDHHVVVCPNSLKGNWRKEIESLDIKTDVFVWPDVPRRATQPITSIINYEAIGVGQGEPFLEDMMKQSRVMMTLDESVCIKNPKSKRGQAIQRLGKMAARKRELSGFPMPQSAADMWAQLHFIDAIPGFDFWPFKHTFCKFGGYLGKAIVGVKNEDRLHALIEKTGFRALKSAWMADLPEKSYVQRDVQMTEIQKEHYLDILNDFYTIVREQEVSPKMAVSQLMKLQQIASGFVISDNGEEIGLDGGNPKADELMEYMEQVSGKVIIPVVFRYSMRYLTERLKKAGHNPVAIHGMNGTMKPEQVEQIKYVFNDDPSCRAILLQMQSQKFGHTLLGCEEAGYCFNTFFYENSFNADDRVQMEDRNHRFGQQWPVLYTDPVCAPIDVKIIDSLKRKIDVSNSVLDAIRSGELR